MFERLGHGIARRPWLVLAGWLVLLTLGLTATFQGFGQGGLFDRMATTAAHVPGSESEEVADLTATSDTGDAITLVVTGVVIPDDVPELMQIMPDQRTLFTDIPGVDSVTDPLVVVDPTNPLAGLQDPSIQALISTEQDGFVVVVNLASGLDEDASTRAHDDVSAAAGEFATDLVQDFPDAQVLPLSDKIIGDDITTLVQDDLVRGESVGLPVALLLMVIVFGGLLAAGLPLVGAVVSIVIGLGGIWLLTFVMDINSFILNVISIIGLALSIDYGLLVVSRYREEVTTRLTSAGYPANGSRLPDRRTSLEIVAGAAQRTVATAGRTVTFSALTIALSIAGLLVFSSPVLRAIALGGIIVTLLAVLTAVTLVPAVIVLLGPALLHPSLLNRIPGLRSLTRAVGDASSDEGGFSRLARFVQRIPWVVIVVVVAILAVMAHPLGGLKMRSSFVEYLPSESVALAAYTTIQDDYPALASPEIVAVADVPVAESAALVEHIEGLDAITYVTAVALPSDDGQTELGIHVDTDDRVSESVVSLVDELRDYDPGYGFLVGGDAAMQEDFSRSLINGAPAALAIVVVAVMVLLFLMTGSLIVPLKALLINLFSLAASLGATVWIFEGGHLGMPRTNGLETFIVACMVAFGFGLSMDYEVFLVARIKEYWDAGLDNDEAVARGLQRSGRILTSAAAIIVAVFIGFVSGQMQAIKQIGVALAIMVAADATLVRMLLVPATMTVLGKWNWWAPKPLRVLHERFGINH